MKIAVSGTQCIGKSTFIEDFMKNWPLYKKPVKSYRDLLKESGKVTINQLGDEESQRAILDSLIDQVQACTDEFVIFDRCPWDNLVYTLWLNALGKVSDKFVKETIALVKESMVYFDIVFFLPICKQSPVIVTEAENRDIDPYYRENIDVLFKSLMDAYNKHSTVYYPFDSGLGCPAIIEIFGNRPERVQLSKFYINEDGSIFGDEDSLITEGVGEEMKQDKLDLAREAFGLR